MFPFSKLSKNLNGKSSRKRGNSRNQRSQRKTQLPTSISTYKTFEKKVTKERKKKKLKDNLKFLTHSKKLLYIRPLKQVDTTTKYAVYLFSTGIRRLPENTSKKYPASVSVHLVF